MKNLFLPLFIFVVCFNLVAQTCNVSDWDNQQIYLANDQVKYNGTVYKAKWWIQGKTPNNAPYGPWQFEYLCPNEMVDPSSCTNLFVWSSTVIYTGGESVKYNGVKYKSNYYSQNLNPATNSGENISAGKPWLILGDCNTPNVTVVGTLQEILQLK